MAWLGDFDSFDEDYGSINAVRNAYAQSTTKLGRDAACRDVFDSPISDLTPYMTNPRIVGLVISKEEPREINKKASDGSPVYILNFSVRDTADWYINVSCWGNPDFVTSLATTFHWGDIVEITNAQVQTKPTDGSSTRFRPYTTSAYQLNVSEKYSRVSIYGGWDTFQYSSLQNVLIRPSNDYYVLGDILSAGRSLNNEHVNLLAAIRHIGKVRELMSKKGQKLKRCEVKLFDETCPAFVLILWNEELIAQTSNWIPGQYVIFATDAKVYYDDYRSSMVATCDSRTILIVNPDTKEAHDLYQYAQNNAALIDCSPDAAVDDYADRDPQISEIKSVLSVREVKDILSDCPSTKFVAVFGYVTSFDIDSDSKDIVRYKCSSCNQLLRKVEPVCLNAQCVGKAGDMKCLVMEYNIAIGISDHTGTLTFCHLYPELAEHLLLSKAEEYINGRHAIDHWTTVKWQYLLERFKFYLKIQRSKTQPNGTVRVMFCETSSIETHMSYVSKNAN